MPQKSEVTKRSKAKPVKRNLKNFETDYDKFTAKKRGRAGKRRADVWSEKVARRHLDDLWKRLNPYRMPEKRLGLRRKTSDVNFISLLQEERLILQEMLNKNQADIMFYMENSGN